MNKFCYLGELISAAGGVEENSGWKKFRELLPLLTYNVFSLSTKGNIFQAYDRSVVPYGSETREVKEVDLAKLERNDMMMVRWMCHVTLKDRKSSNELRDRPGLVSIRNCIKIGRLRRFGHVERLDKDRTNAVR